MKHSHSSIEISVQTPSPLPFQGFDDARLALARLLHIYERNSAYIRHAFIRSEPRVCASRVRLRAYYTALRMQVDNYQEVDSRLSFGHVVEQGLYETTITQTRLFYDYLFEQISLLVNNPRIPLSVGE